MATKRFLRCDVDVSVLKAAFFFTPQGAAPGKVSFCLLLVAQEFEMNEKLHNSRKSINLINVINLM